MHGLCLSIEHWRNGNRPWKLYRRTLPLPSLPTQVKLPPPNELKETSMRIALLIATLTTTLAAAPASADALCSVGDRAQVSWKGQWYPARVTKVNEDQTKCFIRYDGYGSEWDEWVASDRIKVSGRAMPGFQVGDNVQVKWKGEWYPASVEMWKNASINRFAGSRNA
jgi:hypothetical protein